MSITYPLPNIRKNSVSVPICHSLVKKIQFKHRQNVIQLDILGRFFVLLLFMALTL